ncbi:MAG TPA: cytochrome c [Thiobacillaceae bacterium]
MKRLAALLLTSTFPSALAADPPPGRAKARVCVTCHGPVGISSAPDAPHLAGQPRIYLAEQLKAFRSGKRRHEVMNVIAKPLSDADIADLSEWYSSILVEARERP